jgi:hypothetical protein
MRVLAQGLRHACSAPRGVTLPEDAVRWEANRTHSECLWERRQRRRAWTTIRPVARAQGVDTPFEPESSGGDDEEEDEDEEEWEVTPPPHSPTPPPPKTSPRFVTSSTSKRESLLARAGRNGPRRRLGHRSVCHHSPASHWYFLTYRG